MTEVIMTEAEKLEQRNKIKELAIQVLEAQEEARLAQAKARDAILELEILYQRPLSPLQSENIIQYGEELYLLSFEEAQFIGLKKFGDTTVLF